MGQVYDIPFSALIATLLLKKREVTFDEIGEFSRVISNKSDCDCYVIDDVYVNDLVYSIDDMLSMFLVLNGDFFSINSDSDYDSVIGKTKLTVRKILEMTAGYPGNILLDQVGYQKQEADGINIVDKKHGKMLTRVRSRFFNNGKIKITNK